jgi:DNA-binding beta-propeller fold protein YncE
MMTKTCWGAATTFATLVGIGIIGGSTIAHEADDGSVRGTIWVANRGTHDIKGFDAVTGDVVHTVAMGANSAPGDLAYANGKLYVAEEMATPPAIAVVDPVAGDVRLRIQFPPGSRPHHVHVSASGSLVAVGLYGTDTVGVIDTSSDALLGPWDSNPATSNGRVHAAVFSPDENTLYLASDASNEVIALNPRTGEIYWRLNVPAAHELALTGDQKFLYVSRRTANQIARIRLRHDPTRAPKGFTDIIALGLPDTLQLSASDQILTVGLRTRPAQLAVVSTLSLKATIVNVTAVSELSVAGHQSTIPDGLLTFVTWEGGTGANQGIAVIDHEDGNRVVRTISYPGQPHGIVLAPQ